MTESFYNIFYTDDDADDQEVFKEAIAEINEDIFIFTQNNGDELIEMLKNPPPRPRLIFLDLNMPVKNGYEVLKEIRQTEKTKHLPVIIFSTSSDDEAITFTKSLGATLYIPKPTSYAELKRTLREILSVNWDTYKPGDKNFVYKAKKQQEI
jgi:CheY-like chemotaxis protein